MRAIPVQDQSQVSEARRAAVALAQRLGFDEQDAGRVAIVATELATNLIKHAGGGELLVGSYEHGVECLALDRGPGMADLPASRRDGQSTAGSPGLGLGAIARLSQELDIYSRPRQGTAILARLRPAPLQRARAQPPDEALWGAVSIPKTGEEVCGDAWSVQPHDGALRLLVADGLGHGPHAADAANAAVRAFADHHVRAPGPCIEHIHLALRPTRGAAVAVADLDPERGSVVFAGIGNIAGILYAGTAPPRRMVSHNGTAGHVARRVQAFDYPFVARPLVILCSDGLATSWTLETYPGLSQRHPSLIAGILYRDFSRGRDDVTVLVARGAAPPGPESQGFEPRGSEPRGPEPQGPEPRGHRFRDPGHRDPSPRGMTPRDPAP